MITLFNAGRLNLVYGNGSTEIPIYVYLWKRPDAAGFSWMWPDAGPFMIHWP